MYPGSTSKAPKCLHPKFAHYIFANTDTKKRKVLIAINASVSFQLHNVVQDVQGQLFILSASFKKSFSYHR